MRINEYIPVDGKYFNRQVRETQWRPAATRRPRLTLKHLSKLRKQREIRKVEKLKHDAAVIEIYKDPDTDRKSKH